jgi:hypothetical protein
MKKAVLITAAVVLMVALVGTVAFAARGGCWGPGGGKVDLNAFKQFQKETSPLRDEMMAKGVELRNEYAKEKPDKAAITKLRAEMGDIRTKIQAAAEKNGLPAWGKGRGTGSGSGEGRGFGGRGNWGGHKRGFGRGPGACCGQGGPQGNAN